MQCSLDSASPALVISQSPWPADFDTWQMLWCPRPGPIHQAGALSAWLPLSLFREFTIKYDGLAFVCCLASSCPSCSSPSLSLSIFDLVAAARRQVCNSISLLFNPAPQSPAIRLCARFMYYICILQQVRGAKEIGKGGRGDTIRPGHKLAAQDAPLNNNYDNNKSKISCAAVA